MLPLGKSRLCMIGYISKDMLNKKSELVKSYIDEIHELINNKVQRIGNSIDKKGKTTLKVIQEQLKLNDANYWGFICTSMDLIGDTTLAIQNFEAYGFGGPTKIINYGEMYIRLYGFLTATYLQENSVLTLCTCLNVPGKTKFKERINGLEICDIRNKIASHNTNYIIKGDQEVDTFNYGDIHLGSGSLLMGSYTKDSIDEVNLFEKLDPHFDVVLDGLDSIYEKTIKTIYKPNKDKQKEFIEKLKILRSERKGNIVLRIKR